MESDIVIVSGLPRSGTSLMMQMLHLGGIPILTDHVRQADADNPRGYFEYERVKRTKSDPSWLPEARGKAVKMVSSLLYDLPHTETYRILFMVRNLDEVLASQTKMLQRLGSTVTSSAPMKQSFNIHLQRLSEWLSAQPHMRVQRIDYNSLITDPDSTCRTLCEFLDRRLDMSKMCTAIDPTLYRNRNDG